MKRVLWLLPMLFFFSCAHRTVVGGRGARGENTLASRPTSSRVCQPLSAADRERLLSEADPGNFPATRYRRGPSAQRGIEKETDCSHFVHEVYRRAGLPFAFRATADLGSAREFDILPEKAALPGDLMLFRGHVGIVDEEGRIISALTTRHRRRKSSIAKLDRSHFRTFRGQRYVLRYRCQPPAAKTAERATASERKRR